MHHVALIGFCLLAGAASAAEPALVADTITSGPPTSATAAPSAPAPQHATIATPDAGGQAAAPEETRRRMMLLLVMRGVANDFPAALLRGGN